MSLFCVCILKSSTVHVPSAFSSLFDAVVATCNLKFITIIQRLQAEGLSLDMIKTFFPQLPEFIVCSKQLSGRLQDAMRNKQRIERRKCGSLCAFMLK